ncbi:MAG: undecaprenyldiphospho-muramoylpentapeptide beta-N-acetylglucosaminyltransferase [Myxococcota bacterium]
MTLSLSRPEGFEGGVSLHPKATGEKSKGAPEKYLRETQNFLGQKATQWPQGVIIAGGGTGGHVFTGLAIAQELKRLQPTGQILFVGSRSGLEARAIPQAGFPLSCIGVSGLKGKPWWRKVSALARAGWAVCRALWFVYRFRPGVVLGVGGYAGGPVVLAAWLLRIPTAICEPNSVPGLTNRLLKPFVKRVYGGFRNSMRWFDAKRFVLTGIPLRSDLRRARAPAPSTSNKPVRVLILGGSQGARALNQAVPTALGLLRQHNVRLHVTHQSGAADHAEVEQAYARHGLTHVRVAPFIDDIAAAYAACDLLIARAGAGTCAEIAQVGAVTILIPLPTAADDHQTHNALELANVNAAAHLLQQDLTPQRLSQLMLDLIRDPQRRAKMQQAARRQAQPNAAEHIARDLMRLANKSR